MDFRFREVDLRSPYSPRFSAAGDSGFFATQSFLARQREIDKERIREEILAAEELDRKRELEHEVRRELALEREIAAFHGRWNLPSVSEPRVPLPAHPLLPINEARVLERFPLPPLSEARVVKPASFSLEARIDNRLALEQRVPEMGAIERIHAQRPSGPFPGQRFVKGETFLESRKQPTKLSGNPSTVTLTEKKRKAAATAAAGVQTQSQPSQWRCDLCNVKCNSERVLMDHRTGKKHITAAKNKASCASFEKGNKTPVPGKKGGDGATKQKKQKTGEKKVDDFKFWCEHCKIGSLSEGVFQSHLKGKKHLLTMIKFKSGGEENSEKVEDDAKRLQGVVVGVNEEKEDEQKEVADWS